MATRKRILAALLCAAALALLAVPTAAAKTVYFTAVNENILELLSSFSSRMFSFTAVK